MHTIKSDQRWIAEARPKQRRDIDNSVYRISRSGESAVVVLSKSNAEPLLYLQFRASAFDTFPSSSLRTVT